MIIDFHTHTYHSYDSFMEPARILKIAAERGLSGIVINDHNTIKGGLECQAVNKNANLQVIVGAEIATDIGDVTGIFLKEEISSRKFSDVIQEIKNQGGLTILNHPFVGHKLDELNFDGIDLIEGFNSRVDFDRNMLAVALANKLNKPVIAGSDAHLYAEIGRCKTLYNNNDYRQPVSCEYSRNPIMAYVFSQYIKSFKRKDLNLLINVTLGIPGKLLRHQMEVKKHFIYQNQNTKP